MSLTHIEYGSLASSEVLNDNFEYLDNRITDAVESSISGTTSLLSNIANVNTTLTEADRTLRNDLTEIGNDLTTLTESFNAHNNAPDYTHGVGITLPYTVEQDGYVYAGVDGIDNDRFVYVNGNIVHGHCGYSGGYGVYSGSLFRVSSGDVITCDRAYKSYYYFYPMKGGN